MALEIFGIAAFLIALLALWVVNEALKRVGRQNEEFVEAYIEEGRGYLAGNDAAIAECSGQVSSLKKRLEALERGVVILKGQAVESTGNFESEIQRLRAELLLLRSRTQPQPPSESEPEPAPESRKKITS